MAIGQLEASLLFMVEENLNLLQTPYMLQCLPLKYTTWTLICNKFVFTAGCGLVVEAWERGENIIPQIFTKYLQTARWHVEC